MSSLPVANCFCEAGQMDKPGREKKTKQTKKALEALNLIFRLQELQVCSSYLLLTHVKVICVVFMCLIILLINNN